MFFTSTVSMDLETRRDVLHAYPDWHLIFKDGQEIRLLEYALQGDKDHMEYMARDEVDQTKTRYITYEEGLNRIKTNQEIMLAKETNLKGWLRSNPHHVQVS